MGRGLPSMTALLGILAVAGYQNRDKLAEMLRGAGDMGSGARGSGAGEGGLGGLLGSLAGAGGLGGLLSGGLGELMDRLKQNGRDDLADSWLGPGENQSVAPSQLEQAIGSDVLDDLEQQTGLSRDEILARLSRDLPEAVNQYTPEGRLPT